MAETLSSKGFVVIDNFFEDWKILKQEADELLQKNAFRPAQIGQGNALQQDITQRGDNIVWLENANLSPTQKAFFDKIDTLQSFLNQTFFWGTNDVELHFALYQEGMFYQKHLDNFKGKNARRLSFILYLNEYWKEGDGGELRIFLPNEIQENQENELNNTPNFIDVAPLAGRLACFVSAEIWHEVLPTNTQRYSLTGWLRRA